MLKKDKLMVNVYLLLLAEAEKFINLQPKIIRDMEDFKILAGLSNFSTYLESCLK